MKFLSRIFKKVTGKISGFFMKIINKRRQIARALFQVAYCVGSVALSGYVLSYFLPMWLAGAILSTIVVHEFGHYITAKRLGRRVDLPFFVPFVWVVLGATRIHNRGSVPEADARIHLAGPSWGFIWAVAGAAAAGWYGLTQPAWAFVWLAAFNLWHGTFGSDGKFYAAMKKQMEEINHAAARTAQEVIEGYKLKAHPFTPVPSTQ